MTDKKETFSHCSQFLLYILSQTTMEKSQNSMLKMNSASSPLGSPRGALGGLLGPALGSSGDLLEPTLADITLPGASGGPLGAHLGPRGGLLGASRRALGGLMRVRRGRLGASIPPPDGGSMSSARETICRLARPFAQGS